MAHSTCQRTARPRRFLGLTGRRRIGLDASGGIFQTASHAIRGSTIHQYIDRLKHYFRPGQNSHREHRDQGGRDEKGAFRFWKRDLSWQICHLSWGDWLAVRIGHLCRYPARLREESATPLGRHDPIRLVDGASLGSVRTSLVRENNQTFGHPSDVFSNANYATLAVAFDFGACLSAGEKFATEVIEATNLRRVSQRGMESEESGNAEKNLAVPNE